MWRDYSQLTTRQLPNIAKTFLYSSVVKEGCARVGRPKPDTVTPVSAVEPASGRCALARGSYGEALAPGRAATPTVGDYSTGKLTLFAPGLTAKGVKLYVHVISMPKMRKIRENLARLSSIKIIRIYK